MFATIIRYLICILLRLADKFIEDSGFIRRRRRRIARMMFFIIILLWVLVSVALEMSVENLA